jgi:guanylate kinase
MSEFLANTPEEFSLTPETEPQGLGHIVVITGRSGAGKDMLKEELGQDSDLNLTNIVTYTNRPKRSNEVDGVDYYFLSPEEFAQKEQEDFFAEVAPTGSSMKGTSRVPFNAVFEGQSVQWRIDISRAATLEEFYIDKFGEEKGKQLYQQTIIILVDVSDHELLQERYKLRDPGKYDENEYNLRYHQESELLVQYGDRFNNIVLNDGDKEGTVMQAKEIILNYFTK